MGFEGHSFTFSVLYVLTLCCIVAVAILRFRYRYRNSNQHERDISSILECRLAKGEIDEEEYQRLKKALIK